MQFNLQVTPTMKWYAIAITSLIFGALLADNAGSESAFGLIGFMMAFLSGILLLGLIFRSVTTELEEETEAKKYPTNQEEEKENEDEYES